MTKALHTGFVKARLSESPAVALLGTRSTVGLPTRPWVGASWEGNVIEQVLGTLAALGRRVEPWFFRTSDGLEIDLLLDLGNERWAIEVKLTSQPDPHDLDRLNRAADLVGATRRILVSQTRRPTLTHRQSSTGLLPLLELLAR